MRFYKISLPPSQKVTGKLSYRSNLQVRIFLLGGDGDPNHETFLGGVQIFSATPQYGCHMHLKIFCKVNGYSHSTSQAKKSQRYSITSTSLSGFKHRLRSVMHMSFWIAPELNIYPRGWGNLKGQSPLAQVLLKKKKSP